MYRRKAKFKQRKYGIIHVHSTPTDSGELIKSNKKQLKHYAC